MIKDLKIKLYKILFAMKNYLSGKKVVFKLISSI